MEKSFVSKHEALASLGRIIDCLVGVILVGLALLNIFHIVYIELSNHEITKLILFMLGWMFLRRITISRLDKEIKR